MNSIANQTQSSANIPILPSEEERCGTSLLCPSASLLIFCVQQQRRKPEKEKGIAPLGLP